MLDISYKNMKILRLVRSKNMIIGIDIDDTLTDIRDEVGAEALKYAKSLNKEIDEKKVVWDKNNNGSSFKERYNLNYDELLYFFGNIQEKITKKAKPREDVVEVLKNLRKDGHKIYIVTARDSEFHNDPYGLSKTWLDKNNIEYDKLIVDARDKAKVCKEQNVDLFIDDKLSNCQGVSNEGIVTIRITNYTDPHQNIINKKNWKEIYEYIKQL
jgi:uncharacterized HAD superfamily protein